MSLGCAAWRDGGELIEGPPYGVPRAFSRVGGHARSLHTQLFLHSMLCVMVQPRAGLQTPARSRHCPLVLVSGTGGKAVLLGFAPRQSRRERPCLRSCAQQLASSNGSASVLTSVAKSSLQTSSQAVLTTFTFPAALAGDDVTLSGSSHPTF